ncbi:hypothetical protein B0H14DRAFT_2979706 [Mycena olivaceomarginata]|nr:hypothetical protein B0H14DRAFT_2979706 [Mycena olivaceomarginata]
MSAAAGSSAGPARTHPGPNEALRFAPTELRGNLPFFNDWGSSTVDHQREKLYMYGGVRPRDDDNIPTSDFHCLDLKTKQWWNLTDSLKFRPRNYVFDPFFKEDNTLERRKLPALTEPAVAFISVGGGTYFFLFGGYDTENSTSELIAVDLDLLIWWFVDVQGTPLRPRLSASMVAVDNSLFIFGGRENFDSPGIRTYSIAEYTPRTRWTWRVSDAPLPPDLPLLGYGIQSTPVFNGQKILLTRGRTSDKPIDLSRESTIFFHTENHTFHDARTTMGDFPQGIAWYQTASLVVAARRPKLESVSVSPSPTKRPRGRPPKNPAPAAATPVVPTPASFQDSVMLVAWVKHTADDDALVPEAWLYSLPPAERIRCLDIREAVWDLNIDLQAFVAVGNRLFLLGSHEGREGWRVDKPLPRLDIAVEISTEYLKD